MAIRIHFIHNKPFLDFCFYNDVIIKLASLTFDLCFHDHQLKELKVFGYISGGHQWLFSLLMKRYLKDMNIGSVLQAQFTLFQNGKLISGQEQYVVRTDMN